MTRVGPMMTRVRPTVRGARAATVRRGSDMTARDAARDAEAAESRESDARGGDSERPGTPGRDADDAARDGIWNTAELHQRLMHLNVHSSTSSTSSRKSGDPSASGDGLQTTTSGSARGAGASSGTPTGVLPTKLTSKMTTKEVKFGAQSFDSLNQYILIKDLGRGSHSKVK